MDYFSFCFVKFIFIVKECGNDRFRMVMKGTYPLRDIHDTTWQL